MSQLSCLKYGQNDDNNDKRTRSIIKSKPNCHELYLKLLVTKREDRGMDVSLSNGGVVVANNNNPVAGGRRNNRDQASKVRVTSESFLLRFLWIM